MKRSSNGTIVGGRVLPKLNLSEIKVIAENKDDEENDIKLCDTFGFFLSETIKNNNKYWILGDAHLPDGFTEGIKLAGPLDKYPKPLPGDIVRVHRLSFDDRSNCAYIPVGKNVVVWRSFVHKPIILHTSERPTISQSDEEERRKLELVYSNYRTPLKHVKDEQPNKLYFKVAGRVESKEVDKYNHLIIHINDGTAILKLRLFAKVKDSEFSDHHDVGLKLKDGDYIIASSTKRNKSDPQLLDLSANFEWGRCLRFVEPDSILGVKLAEKLADQPINNNNVVLQNQQQEQDNNPSQPVRRSPRLNPVINTSSSPSSQCLPTTKEDFPDYTRICDIKKKDVSRFDYYDLAGRVIGDPRESNEFKNYYVRLYDGSQFKFNNYYDTVYSDLPVENTVTVIVYSPQRPDDVYDHIETAKRIKDGDYILLRNIKVVWREGGKAEFILHPNTRHDKGITIIDKESQFGMYLKERLLPMDEPELSEL